MLSRGAARLLLPLVLFGVAVLNLAIAGGTDWQSMTFYQPDGSEYTIGSAPGRISEEYGLGSRPKIVLVAASNPETDRYEKQQEILDTISAERHQFLLVIGYSESKNQSGYYLRQDAARRVLGGGDFKILLFDGKGCLITASTDPLPKQEIINRLP